MLEILNLDGMHPRWTISWHPYTIAPGGTGEDWLLLRSWPLPQSYRSKLLATGSSDRLYGRFTCRLPDIFHGLRLMKIAPMHLHIVLGQQLIDSAHELALIRLICSTCHPRLRNDLYCIAWDVKP